MLLNVDFVFILISKVIHFNSVPCGSFVVVTDRAPNNFEESTKIKMDISDYETFFTYFDRAQRFALKMRDFSHLILGTHR